MHPMLRALLVSVVVAVCAPVSAQELVPFSDPPLWHDTSALSRAHAFPSDERCTLAAQRWEAATPILDDALRVTLPRLDGGEPTSARMRRWADTELRRFLDHASARLGELDDLVVRVVELGCVTESIVALTAYGLAYERLYAALRGAPRWQGPGDGIPPGCGAYEDAIEPVRWEAIMSYEAGLALARAHLAFGDAARRCAEGLERLGELPADDELVSSEPWRPEAFARHR